MKFSLLPTIAGALALAVAPAFMAIGSPAYAANAPAGNSSATSKPAANASAANSLAAKAQSDASSVKSTLDKASQFNHQQQAMAGVLNTKAGDSLALSSMATSLKEDNAANQNAVETIANKEHVKLKPYQPNTAKIHKLANLKGAGFEKAFIGDEIQQNEKALKEMKQARSQMRTEPMREYLDETIPVVQAHLKMAQNLQHDMKSAGGSNASKMASSH